MEENDRVLRKPEVLLRVGLSDPSIWRRERLGQFPKRISLGGKSVGWLASEINTWLEKKADARRSTGKNCGGAGK